MSRDSQAEPSREELVALIAAQAEQIAALTARVADLERRLGLDSSNSGKPPSRDLFKKPSRGGGLRSPAGNRGGGQKGHPGATLRKAESRAAISAHYPKSRTRCGAALTAALTTGPGSRQVFALPGPCPFVVPEPRPHACR